MSKKTVSTKPPAPKPANPLKEEKGKDIDAGYGKDSAPPPPTGAQKSGQIVKKGG